MKRNSHACYRKVILELRTQLRRKCQMVRTWGIKLGHHAHAAIASIRYQISNLPRKLSRKKRENVSLNKDEEEESRDISKNDENDFFLNGKTTTEKE